MTNVPKSIMLKIIFQIMINMLGRTILRGASHYGYHVEKTLDKLFSRK